MCPDRLNVVTRPRLDHHRERLGLDSGRQQQLPSPFQRSWWLEGVAPHGTTYALVLDGDRLARRSCAARAAASPAYAAMPRPGRRCCAPTTSTCWPRPGSEEVVAGVVGEWFARPGPTGPRPARRRRRLAARARTRRDARAAGCRAVPVPAGCPGDLPGGALRPTSAGAYGGPRKALPARGSSIAASPPPTCPDAFAAFRSLHEGREGTRAAHGPDACSHQGSDRRRRSRRGPRRRARFRLARSSPCRSPSSSRVD